jgi:hypothetical protein
MTQYRRGKHRRRRLARPLRLWWRCRSRLATRQSWRRHDGILGNRNRSWRSGRNQIRRDRPRLYIHREPLRMDSRMRFRGQIDGGRSTQLRLQHVVRSCCCCCRCCARRRNRPRSRHRGGRAGPDPAEHGEEVSSVSRSWLLLRGRRGRRRRWQRSGSRSRGGHLRLGRVGSRVVIGRSGGGRGRGRGRGAHRRRTRGRVLIRMPFAQDGRPSESVSGRNRIFSSFDRGRTHLGSCGKDRIEQSHPSASASSWGSHRRRW